MCGVIDVCGHANIFCCKIDVTSLLKKKCLLYFLSRILFLDDMTTAVYDCIQPINSISATIKCEYAEILHAGLFFKGISLFKCTFTIISSFTER